CEAACLVGTDEVRAAGLYQTFLDNLHLLAGHLREERRFERPANDCRSTKELYNIRREPREALADRYGHACGERGCDWCRQGPMVVNFCQNTCLHPATQQLFGEEWVALAMGKQ